MLAVFTSTVPPVPLLTVAASTSVTLAPLARLPTLHPPVPVAYVPWLGVAAVSVSPAGSGAATAIPAAGSGPLLMSVSV